MKQILISEKADNQLKDFLNTTGYPVKLMDTVTTLDSPINYHPDIFYCQLKDAIWEGNPNLLSPKYPGDVIYNGCSTGKYFIHNTKYTHPDLLAAAEKLNLTVIYVPQGYARCTILPVGENAIITSDEGSARICEKWGLEVLLISQGYIKLRGYKYGFIGGCAGRIDDTIVFHGNLAKHPDGKRIRQFIEERELKIKDFSDFQLEDIGSILFGKYKE